MYFPNGATSDLDERWSSSSRLGDLVKSDDNGARGA